MWVGAGWVAGQHAVDIAMTITHYSWWIIGGTFALILIYSFWSAWRNPREEIAKPQ
jgi:hypothetical protein